MAKPKTKTKTKTLPELGARACTEDSASSRWLRGARKRDWPTLQDRAGSRPTE